MNIMIKVIGLVIFVVLLSGCSGCGTTVTAPTEVHVYEPPKFQAYVTMNVSGNTDWSCVDKFEEKTWSASERTVVEWRNLEKRLQTINSDYLIDYKSVSIDIIPSFFPEVIAYVYASRSRVTCRGLLPPAYYTVYRQGTKIEGRTQVYDKLMLRCEYLYGTHYDQDDSVRCTLFYRDSVAESYGGGEIEIISKLLTENYVNGVINEIEGFGNGQD